MNVFFRNGLISHLKGDGNLNSYGDNRESTIPLKAFDKEDDDNYCRYLKSDFLGHRGLDNLTKTVKDNLRDHFLEVFINAVQHANPILPIYACGQYFPEKNILLLSSIFKKCSKSIPIGVIFMKLSSGIIYYLIFNSLRYYII